MELPEREAADQEGLIISDVTKQRFVHGTHAGGPLRDFDIDCIECPSQCRVLLGQACFLSAIRCLQPIHSDPRGRPTAMSTSTVAKERHESMRHTPRNRAKVGHSPLVRAPMCVARSIGTKRIGLWTPGTLGDSSMAPPGLAATGPTCDPPMAAALVRARCGALVMRMRMRHRLRPTSRFNRDPGSDVAAE